MKQFICRLFAGAFFLRELKAILLARFIHIFWGLALLAGLIPVIFETNGGEGYFLLQWCLYILPLFAAFAGIASAQNEGEETFLLLSQPVASSRRIWEKFLALWLIVAMAGVPLLLPGLIQGENISTLFFLFVHAIAAGGIFTALGLAVGFSTQDRVKAYLGGLCIWLVLIVGFGLIALATANSGFAESSPQIWVTLLMLNPIEAMRVGALLNIGQIPFDRAAMPPLARWWLENLKIWYLLLAGIWITASLLWATNRLERRRNS
ncbi:MAG: hypothetical protein ACK5NG_02760 [Chthoniobacterales bacterium]